VFGWGFPCWTACESQVHFLSVYFFSVYIRCSWNCNNVLVQGIAVALIYVGLGPKIITYCVLNCSYSISESSHPPVCVYVCVWFSLLVQPCISSFNHHQGNVPDGEFEYIRFAAWYTIICIWLDLKNEFYQTKKRKPFIPSFEGKKRNSIFGSNFLKGPVYSAVDLVYRSTRS
jgi:hypothetical protein